MAENENVDHIPDDELDSGKKRKSARAWLATIKDAEKAFEDYQHRADSIDKLYADLEKLSADARDRQFQLFWSTVQVQGPSIYSRPPVPVVVPKFKDRDPVKRVASELLERCSVITFDQNDINSIMLLLRDDLTIQARGAVWVRYETSDEGEYDTEKVCFDHVDRKDFLHEPARNWLEVGWVAKASHLTKTKMRKRFKDSSGDAYKNAAYAVRKEDRDNGAADRSLTAKVWEIWSKTDNRVYWVTEGCEDCLDDDKPHLKLEGFFPCPKPAYGTTQRRSLVPVQEMLQYKDQLEEINQLTSRIHSLADSIKVRAFYPAGAGEIGDAIEAAIKSHDDRQIIVPVSNFAMFGNGSVKDTIIWLPIDQVAAAVRECVQLRKEIISDVYQIVGISDIMRGSTEKEETATAQNIKAQFGSVRVRDKQSELVRIARDIQRIAAEIMAEEFGEDTLLEMSQMEIPSAAEIKKRMQAVQAGAEKEFQEFTEKAKQNPETMAAAKENPQAAQGKLEEKRQQIIQNAQEQVQKLAKQPTQEAVFELLRTQKIRAFSLDIETDSTIQPDEDAEKQRRTEFLGMLGGVMKQVGEMVVAQPSTAPFAGEVIKFAVAPFRAGRQMDQAIDEFVDQMTAQFSKPQPNPEAEAAKQEAETEKQRSQADMQMKQAELQAKMQIEQMKMQGDKESRMLDAKIKQQEAGMKMQQIQAEEQRDEKRFQMEMQKLQLEMQFKEHELGLKAEAAQIDNAAKMQTAEIQADSAQQQASIKAEQAEQQMDHNERSFVQQSALADQKASQMGAGQ